MYITPTHLKTRVFAAFEAGDSNASQTICKHYNGGKLSIEYNIYTNYREKTIRVFLVGDYDFIMKSYGLSGPSGNVNMYIHTAKQMLFSKWFVMKNVFVNTFIYNFVILNDESHLATKMPIFFHLLK